MHVNYRMIWIILAVFMLSAPVSAATLENDRCMNCHGNKDIKSPPGKNVFIDQVKFASTSHAIVGCSSCHDRVTSGHPGDGSAPPKARCGDCHNSVYEEYTKSLHVSKAGCNDCHNPHEVKLPIFMSGDEINSKCAKCHDTRKIIKSHSKWLTQADLHIDALLCITCHTGSKDYVITMTIESHLPGTKNVFKTATYEELAKLTKGKTLEG